MIFNNTFHPSLPIEETLRSTRLIQTYIQYVYKNCTNHSEPNSHMEMPFWKEVTVLIRTVRCLAFFTERRVPQAICSVSCNVDTHLRQEEDHCDLLPRHGWTFECSEGATASVLIYSTPLPLCWWWNLSVSIYHVVRSLVTPQKEKIRNFLYFLYSNVLPGVFTVKMC